MFAELATKKKGEKSSFCIPYILQLHFVAFRIPLLACADTSLHLFCTFAETEGKLLGTVYSSLQLLCTVILVSNTFDAIYLVQWTFNTSTTFASVHSQTHTHTHTHTFITQSIYIYAVIFSSLCVPNGCAFERITLLQTVKNCIRASSSIGITKA